MRKWREIHSLRFLIFSLFPPPLSFSYTKCCLILSRNVKYGTFVPKVTKKLNIRAYEEIVLGQIHCEEASQVVRAWEKYRDT